MRPTYAQRPTFAFIPPLLFGPRTTAYAMTSPRRSKRIASSSSSSSPTSPRASPPSKLRRTVAATASSSPVPAVPPLAPEPHVQAVLKAEKKMSDALSALTFRSPVSHVYNPLEYAWEAHEWYVRTFATRRISIMLVGMNPGPWGMAQTGVPFGEVNAVKNFLGMPADIRIDRPTREHPARPVTGLDCHRSEVSGRRLWGEFAASHTTAEFFANYWVHNYCPLMFMEQKNGRNRTPVQLPAAERATIEPPCDDALRAVVHALRPQAIAGIGAYARDKCERALATEINAGLVVGTVLHPSPASPAANKGWLQKATVQLDELKDVIANNSKDWTAILDEAE